MPNDAPIGKACDCHVHAVGPIDRYPQIAARCYTAGLAPIESLRGLAEPLGVSRFVIVQPSFYGTDSRCLLETLDALGERGRGVAAADSGASAALLREYARRGVRGLRVNLYSAACDYPAHHLDKLLKAAISILPEENWHVEIIAPLAMLASASETIGRTDARIVIDHYGLPGESPPESRAGRCLLDLVALPHVWVKLSAPYRTLADPLATTPPSKWLEALVRAAPGRCVWGSDWPHTPPQDDRRGASAVAAYRKIEYERVLRDFCGALRDTRLEERILIANPTRLYGFSAQ